MKRLSAVALVVLGLAAGFTLPACAQRGGSRGGFSGHTGPAFRGGIARSASSGVGRPSGFSGNRSSGLVPGYRRAVPGNSFGRSRYPGNSGYHDRNRHRMPYISPYSARYPYPLAPVWPGWWDPGYLGFPDDSGYDDSQAAPNDAGGEYDTQQPHEQDQPAFRPPYQPSTAPLQPQPAPESEDAVTLIFKDGRPPEQIRNYILTSTTLFIQDQHRQVIPVDQLDLVATEKTNQEAGVAFHLPGGAR